MKASEGKRKESQSVRDFFAKFDSDETCLEHLFNVRFGQGHACPKCERAAKWYLMGNERAYVCQWCGHHIHPTAGTLFHDTRTSLQMWFYAIYLFTTSRHGVSGKELQRQLGVTYKTAWRIGHQIRKHMAEVDGETPLTGNIEIDETWVGGRKPGSGLRGSGDKDKTIVLGILQRDGDVMANVIPDARNRTIHPIIEKNVAKGSTVNTDEFKGYVLFAKWATRTRPSCTASENT
jgi:transposase